MKTAYVSLAIILTLIVFSCSDNTVTTSPTSSKYQLSGKIDNWTYGNMKLVAEAYDSLYVHTDRIDSCEIDAAGNFSLNLRVPGSQYLGTINDSVFAGCFGNMNVNPHNTRFTSLLLSVYDSTRHQFGVVSRKNYDSIIVNGSFQSEYVYCDRAVSISGTVYCVIGQFTTYNIYSWSGTNNWNKAVSVFTVDSTGFISRATMTNNEPTGASWQFHKNPYEVKRLWR